MPPLAAIVILNYNCFQETIECVRSVQRNQRTDLKLIVIDNRSTDESYAELMSALAGSSDVELILAPRNGGFSEGSNIGIVRGLELGARWIHLLNPDAEVSEGFYARLSEIDTAHTDISAVGGLGFFMDERRRIWFGGGRFNWLKARGECEYQGTMLQDGFSQNLFSPSEFLTCACLVVRSDTVREIGVLDNRYFLGGEEWDYSRRLGRVSTKMYIDGALQYWHHVSASLEQKVCLKYIYSGYRTKLLFMKDQNPILFYFWLAPYLCYSRFLARRQFHNLEPSLKWSDILAVIKLAEKDSKRYKSIELSHLSQFD